MANLTKHGQKRIKERLGIPKGSASKAADRAFVEGLKHGECKGDLKRYIDKICLSHGKGQDYRVYNHYIYIFDFRHHNLITTIDLPQKLCGLADKLQKKKATEEINQSENNT